MIETLGEGISARPNDSDELWTELLEIDDARVLPILLKAMDTGNSTAKSEAMTGLAKFNTDAALEGLRKGLAADVGRLRDEAAAALSRSPHPGALPLLIAQRNDKFWGVRLTVLHAIAQKLDRVHAIPLLQEMAGDRNGMVSDEAKRYLKEMSAP